MTGDVCKTPGCRKAASHGSYCRQCKYARTKAAQDIESLKTGGAAVKHKSFRPTLTDAQQMEIDRRCVAIDEKRAIKLDPPRMLSRRQIADLENRGAITPIEMIPYCHDRFANVLTGLVTV